jgi:RNA polymerase sigma-70 factor (ECF subfamily)
MRAYGAAVYRYCRLMIGDATRADDVHQQVFVEAHRDLQRYAGRSSLKSWVFGIARHRCLDAIKSDRRWTDRHEPESPNEHVDPTPLAGDAIDDARLVDALARCLDTLAPATRMAVLLRYQEGFSFEEMGRICRERAGTLQQRVARALPVLRACIEKRTGGRV